MCLCVLYLQDKPYDKDDEVIKATYIEVISMLRDVLETTSLFRNRVQTYTQACLLHIWYCLLSTNDIYQKIAPDKLTAKTVKVDSNNAGSYPVS